ncbi:MAG TPA: hypothetical protein VGG04_19795 [Candidatus Sulfotelmatobacter sp.]|jgi:hypothetical protein
MDPPAPIQKPRFLLVITATITPAASAQVKRALPQVRLEDYKRALRFWLSYPHPAAGRILFLENSGADLRELHAIAESENPQRREVEFLSLPLHEIPAGTNYGYAEMQMLDEGLALSQLRPATTHLIKVTGRLTFPALGKALDRVTDAGAAPLELMIDCRKLGLFRRGYDARVQLFVCSHSFYDRELRGSNREMNTSDVRLLEHLIFRKVIPFKGQPGYHLRFRCNVDPVGYFGFKNRRYDSPRTAFSRGLRGILRAIAPDYWF